ncbi:MAG: DNA repair protein RecO [Clostridia bacterium]|nr:DNA repair protein RecO [Clostridia bacterium]
MEVTTKAIALKATDYKENDKYVLLYSLEYGKISILARGIRKGTAKLRFCADQFCFGQYELAVTGDRYTLKTCEQLESFFSLREDIVSYYAACTVAESLLNYTEEGQSEPALFVETLKALEQLSCGTNPLLVTLRFMLKFFELNGLKLQLDSCIACGKRDRHYYLDLQRGGLVCDACRQIDNIPVSARAIACASMVENIDYVKLVNVNASQDIIKEALTLCYKYISHSYFPLKSLNELIKLA